MSTDLTAIPAFVDAGMSKNTTGVAAATKRGGVWFETSVEEFYASIDYFAMGLHDLGVGRGDRVALHAENSTEWLIVDQAILRLGAVTVPIYTTQPPDQVRFVLEHSEARVYVVSTESLFKGVEPYLRNVAALESTVGILGSYEVGMKSFDDVVARGKARLGSDPEALEKALPVLTPDDLATIIYTSGTTGQPKGVMLTHGNLVFNALQSLENAPFDADGCRGGTVISYLPLSHAYERVVALQYLHIGYPIYFVADVNEFREDLLSVRPVFFTTVPRLLEKVHAGIVASAREVSGVQRSILLWAIGLANRYDVDKPMGARQRLQYALADRLVFAKIRARFGGNLASITSGGAALSPATMNFFHALGVYCGQGYGMTEASPIIATSAPGMIRSGSVGKPMSGVEVAIAEDGEILTRGPHVMRGYYKLPEETAAVKNSEGWLHTGDIGQLDTDGFLYITDRKKELFKLSTGKYVAPAPIEAAIGRSAFIEHVVVVGSQFKFCTALIALDVQAVRGHLGQEVPAAEEDLFEHGEVDALIQAEVDAANASLAHWEQVKRFRLVNSFSIESGELTPTMKIKRRVVHEKYRAEIEAMYA